MPNRQTFSWKRPYVFLLGLLICCPDGSVTQMLAFCQARRQANAAKVSTTSTSTVKAVRNPVQAQALGFSHLQSLGVPVRRTVSSRSISTLLPSPSPSPSPSPVPQPQPTNAPAELTDADRAAQRATQEAEELAYDLRVVRNEKAKYRERGLIPLSELNMVRHWDVRALPLV